tara:strand:+ start:202 stop:513 length:312 start_codon:yes stop_codon:yes gene_type:complete
VIKLKKLINENKYAFDRKFGEPLPTFKGVMKKHQANESVIIDEGVIDDLLKKLMDKLSSGDQKVVKQLSKKDPKFSKSYKQFLKARSDLEASLRANKGMWAPA